MHLFRSVRWLMPALLLCAVSSFVFVQSRSALAQPQAQTGTTPSTTPPANQTPQARNPAVPVKNAPTTVHLPPPPIEPLPDRTPNTRSIPVKPPHGEDPAPMPGTMVAAPARTGPCPPHVICADSGAALQAQPVLPANRQPSIRNEGVTFPEGDNAVTRGGQTGQTPQQPGKPITATTVPRPADTNAPQTQTPGGAPANSQPQANNSGTPNRTAPQPVAKPKND